MGKNKRHKGTEAQRKPASIAIDAGFLCASVPLCLCVVYETEKDEK